MIARLDGENLYKDMENIDSKAERVADKTGASIASEDLGARGRLSPYTYRF